jgi:hypothetical protein
MNGNKEPFNKIEDWEIAAALQVVINPANAPILIHCNKGKVRDFRRWAMLTTLAPNWLRSRLLTTLTKLGPDVGL